MNDEQKSKEQLLQELAQERQRSAQAEERSLALQEVSKLVAAAHDTDEVLDLIVNEAARLVDARAAYIRLLVEEGLILAAATESWVLGASNAYKVEEGGNPFGHEC